RCWSAATTPLHIADDTLRSSMALLPLLTAEDILDMPEARHAELVRGTLVPVSPTNFGHGFCASQAIFVLMSFAKPRRLGFVLSAETGYILARNPDIVRAPDVGFVRADRLEFDDRARRFIDGAPDLAVEVISPRNRSREVTRKTREYLRAGG